MNSIINNCNKIIINYPESSNWNKPILNKLNNYELVELFDTYEVEDKIKGTIGDLIGEYFCSLDYKQLFVHCDTHQECFSLICLLSCFLPEIKEDIKYRGKSMYVLINYSINNCHFFNIFRFSKMFCAEYDRVKTDSIEYKDLILFLRKSISKYGNIIYNKEVIDKLIDICEKEGKHLEDNHALGVNNDITYYLSSKDDADKLEEFLKSIYVNETRLRLFNDLRNYNYKEKRPIRLGIGKESFGYLSSICNFFASRNGQQSVYNFDEFKSTVLYKELLMLQHN